MKNSDEEPQIIRTKEGLEIRINDDGSVTFLNMPDGTDPERDRDVMELALSLDPEAILACDTDE